jgi:hypothetical protein
MRETARNLAFLSSIIQVSAKPAGFGKSLQMRMTFQSDQTSSRQGPVQGKGFQKTHLSDHFSSDQAVTGSRRTDLSLELRAHG